MALLTDRAWQAVHDLSRRYGVSPDAVSALLQAVANGGGSMAQFHVPELGGGGQWMRGGMTMVGDMFNHGLKTAVDGLCGELSDLLASQNPFAPAAGPAPHQSRGGGAGGWWPAGLGSPTATGGQNGTRYAYFADARRLAVDAGGRVTVYDTLDHRIGGVSQQQGGGSSLAFTSQHGPVPVASLPVIPGEREAEVPSPPPHTAPAPRPAPAPPAASAAARPPAGDMDVFAKIERLAELRQKGTITDDEFQAKKTELLSRL